MPKLIRSKKDSSAFTNTVTVIYPFCETPKIPLCTWRVEIVSDLRFHHLWIMCRGVADRIIQRGRLLCLWDCHKKFQPEFCGLNHILSLLLQLLGSVSQKSKIQTDGCGKLLPSTRTTVGDGKHKLVEFLHRLKLSGAMAASWRKKIHGELW